MNTHTRQDELALWKMYIWSGVKAIAQAPDADGITILQTARGNEYCFPVSMNDPYDTQIITALTESEDNHILYLVHIWKNHWLDVPSYSLRKALIDLHPDNKNARLLLIGAENFIVRSVADTMP